MPKMASLTYLATQLGWVAQLGDGWASLSFSMISPSLSRVAGSLYIVLQSSTKVEADILLRSSYTTSLSPHCLPKLVTGPAQNQEAEEETSHLDGCVVRPPCKRACGMGDAVVTVFGNKIYHTWVHFLLGSFLWLTLGLVSSGRKESWDIS